MCFSKTRKNKTLDSVSGGFSPKSNEVKQVLDHFCIYHMENIVKYHITYWNTWETTNFQNEIIY